MKKMISILAIAVMTISCCHYLEKQEDKPVVEKVMKRGGSYLDDFRANREPIKASE